MKICHVTTVHPSFDVRIFHKECCSLAKAGHDVTLLVAGDQQDTVKDGVKIIYAKVKYKNRTGRIFKAPPVLALKAIELAPDVVHFHDPEFLLVANRIIKRGIKVIYDVHEDVPRQILSKYWIPAVFRKLLSVCFEWHENRQASKLDYIVAATPFIAGRFQKVNPATADIKNFPIIDEFPETPFQKPQATHVCYIGGITPVRGIREMVLAMEPLDVTLDIAGSFESEDLYNEVSNLDGWKRCIYHGMIDRKGVAEVSGASLAGLVLLHPIPNYIEALPVKLFEYMLSGIPVIASGFPLWKEIIEQNHCGICVDPLDINAISGAIKHLVDNPDIAEEMGRNGRRMVLEHYNWDKEKDRLLEIYDELDNHRQTT